MDGHQGDVVSSTCQRDAQVETTIVRTTLAGLVVDDEENFQWLGHVGGAAATQIVGFARISRLMLPVPLLAKRGTGHNRPGTLVGVEQTIDLDGRPGPLSLIALESLDQLHSRVGTQFTEQSWTADVRLSRLNQRLGPDDKILNTPLCVLGNCRDRIESEILQVVPAACMTGELQLEELCLLRLLDLPVFDPALDRLARLGVAEPSSSADRSSAPQSAPGCPRAHWPRTSPSQEFAYRSASVRRPWRRTARQAVRRSRQRSPPSSRLDTARSQSPGPQARDLKGQPIRR